MSAVPAPAATRDRLTVTMFLAGVFHLIVILGVSFAPPLLERGDAPTLEVLLVTSTLPDAPENEDADYLAERTQRGSGNSVADRTRQPAAGLAAPELHGLADGTSGPAPTAGGAAGADALLSGSRGTRLVAADAAPSDAAPAPRPRELLAGSDSPFAGDDEEAALELRGATRRELVVTPNTRSSDVAVYLDAWKRRIEQVGTLNFPNAARRTRLSGSPVIEVVLASGGGLVRADVRRSSGHGELDRAAMEILRLATPFEPFPADLARRHDVLRFAYEWQFVGGRLAGSAVGVPTAPD